MTVALLLGGLALAWMAAAAALDWRGRRQPADRFDAIIVAGCRLRPDGTAGLTLRRRVEHAVQLWQAGTAPLVVLTGGAVHGAVRPEAAAAADVATALGVPASALVLETTSENTEANARCAAAILGPVRIVVVTDAYHALRCRRVFGRHFPVVASAGVLTTPKARARGALREVLSLIVYALRGRI
jgi:uncharacterized SAM-binding protein YcdF (DUF218 family)